MWNSIWICETAVFSVHQMQTLKLFPLYYKKKKHQQSLWLPICYSISQATVTLWETFQQISAKHSSLSGFGRSTVYHALPPVLLVFNPQRQTAEIKGNEHTKVQLPSFTLSADVLI